MRTKISILVALLLITVASTAAFAQTSSFQPSPSVYKIKANNCVYQPIQRAQTGFRVNNLQGIVTALHGVVGCKDIAAQPGGNGATYRGLIIAKVDIDRDMALLWSEELATSSVSGFKTVSFPRDSDFINAKIVGYPLNLYRQNVTFVEVTETTALGNLLPEGDIETVADRASPSITITVFSVQSAMLPGHSGAPLMTNDGRVLGVGNGGLDLGRVDLAWAIPLNQIVWKTISTQVSQDISLADLQRMKTLEKLDPKLVFSFGDPLAKATPTKPIVTQPTQPPINSGSSSVAVCQTPVDSDLASYWSPDLGCPTGDSYITWASYTPFERGMMMWRDDTRYVYGFFNNGGWTAVEDKFREGMPDMPSPNRGEPPPGLIHPIRGTGLVWATNERFFQNLGWARQPQRGFCAETQNYQQGFILRNSGQGSCFDNKSGQNQPSRAGEQGFDFVFVKAYNSGQWAR